MKNQIDQTFSNLQAEAESEIIEASSLIYTCDISGIITNAIENEPNPKYILIRDAHFVGRLSNLAVRKSVENEISLPNALVKLFAEKFINEKGETKSGEAAELNQIDGAAIYELLEEASDIVGKYALGIERVSLAQSNGANAKFEGLAEALSNALGFDLEDVLAAFIVKYDSRFRVGKNKEAELKAIKNLLENRHVKQLKTEGSLQERIKRVQKQFGIDTVLNQENDTDSELINLQNMPAEFLYTKVTREELIELDRKRNVQHESGLWKEENFSYWEV